MISISNGWLNNTISYSRINKIAAAAQQQAGTGNTVINQDDHSRDMALGEMIYDYIFCGSVKKEYMENLYTMVYRRESLRVRHVNEDAQSLPGSQERAKRDKAYVEGVLNRPSPRDPLKSRFETRQKSNLCAIRETESPLVRVMPTHTLQYEHNPLDNNAGEHNYLIFRDKRRRIAAGIPVTSQPGAVTSAGTDAVTPAVATYKSLTELQVNCLATLRQSHQLELQKHIYHVRFTKEGEPVVLVADNAVPAASLQKRLTNLWLIENVQQRLTALRERTARTSEASLYQLSAISEGIERAYFKAIDALDKKMTEECAKIETRLKALLKKFESGTDPDWEDKPAFRKLLEEINLHEHVKRSVKAKVEHAKDQAQMMHLEECSNGRMEQTHLVTEFNQETFLILSRADVGGGQKRTII